MEAMTLDKVRNSSFSWGRAAMFVNYHKPLFVAQALIYFGVALLAWGASYALSFTEHFAILGTVFLGALNYLLYFSPLTLAFGDHRLIDAQLPVKAGEKFVVYVVYYLIVLPVCLLGTLWLADKVSGLIAPDHVNAGMAGIMEKFDFGKSTSFFSLVSEFLPTALTLWGVLFFKRMRIFKAIIIPVGTLLLTAIVSGIIAGVTAAKIVINNPAAEDMEPEELQAYTQQLTIDVMHSMETYYLVLGIIASVVIVGMVCLTYRAIKKYQA